MVLSPRSLRAGRMLRLLMGFSRGVATTMSVAAIPSSYLRTCKRQMEHGSFHGTSAAPIQRRSGFLGVVYGNEAKECTFLLGFECEHPSHHVVSTGNGNRHGGAKVPMKSISAETSVDEAFEKMLFLVRVLLESCVEEVIDRIRGQNVVETILALIRSRLDKAKSIKDWYESVGWSQTTATLKQLYQDVGGWDVVLKAVLTKLALTLKDIQSGLGIVDDSSFRKYGMGMDGISNVHCANIKCVVPGHTAVSLMMGDDAEGTFCDVELKVNQSKPKDAKRAGNPGTLVSRARKANKRELAIEMILEARKNGFVIDCVLFDAWYFCADMAKRLAEPDLNLTFISRAKSNYPFVINGKEQTAREFLETSRKHRKQVSGMQHYFYQASAQLKSGIEVKLVAVWFFQGLRTVETVLVTTDFALSGSDVVKTYQKRWATEQGYKTLKHELAWGNYHATDFAKIDVFMQLGLLAYAVARRVQREAAPHESMPTLLKLRRRARARAAALAQQAEMGRNMTAAGNSSLQAA
jgi:hypothetical protein